MAMLIQSRTADAGVLLVLLTGGGRPFFLFSEEGPKPASSLLFGRDLFAMELLGVCRGGRLRRSWSLSYSIYFVTREAGVCVFRACRKRLFFFFF